jgi:hypothetical protein
MILSLLPDSFSIMYSLLQAVKYVNKFSFEPFHLNTMRLMRDAVSTFAYPNSSRQLAIRSRKIPQKGIHVSAG